MKQPIEGDVEVQGWLDVHTDSKSQGRFQLTNINGKDLLQFVGKPGDPTRWNDQGRLVVLHASREELEGIIANLQSMLRRME